MRNVYRNTTVVNNYIVGNNNTVINRGIGRDGVYDQRRDWFYQNVRLMRALSDKGYDVNYTWGINTHGQRMGGPILPEMMRWLWRDHPVSTDVNDQVERSFNEPKKK